jgi:hypothetical protein
MHGQRAAVQLDKPPRQRQAEPVPSCRRECAEAIWPNGSERDLDLGCGHADAGIGDRELDPAIRAPAQGDADRALARRELDRIRQEVETGACRIGNGARRRRGGASARCVRGPWAALPNGRSCREGSRDIFKRR